LKVGAKDEYIIIVIHHLGSI